MVLSSQSYHVQQVPCGRLAARSADATAYFRAPPMVELVARKPLAAAERWVRRCGAGRLDQPAWWQRSD